MNETTLRRGLLRTGALLLVLAASGCADRTNIRDDFGVKVRAFYVKQRVHETAALDSPTGLDSEEAALIQANYRASMGGKAPAQQSQQVLVLDNSGSKEK